jgi:TRAP-type C4-dicarboxylate transport system permease small subunit
MAGSSAQAFVAAVARFTRPIYAACGAGAIVMLVLIIVATVLQMAFRVMEVQIRGLSDLAAYATAGVTFLGLAYTFRSGGLIRVELVIERLPPKWNHVVEIYCLAMSGIVCGAAAVASVQMLVTSHMLGEAALFLPFPIWMAQVPMAIGLAVLTLAFAEALLQQLTGTRQPTRGRNTIADI